MSNSYSTIPADETPINEPKSPQSKLIASVAAICLLSAVAGGAVQRINQNFTARSC